jgi:hypothetical protein
LCERSAEGFQIVVVAAMVRGLPFFTARICSMACWMVGMAKLSLDPVFGRHGL